jgi:hypothetical protein
MFDTLNPLITKNANIVILKGVTEAALRSPTAPVKHKLEEESDPWWRLRFPDLPRPVKLHRTEEQRCVGRGGRIALVGGKPPSK